MTKIRDFANVASGLTATATELNYNDITTLGTSQASKAVTANADGNVGIGTTPETLLHISSGGGLTPFASTQIISESTGNNYIELNGGSTSTVALYFGDNTDQDAGGVLYNHSADTLTLRAAGAGRATINSTGLGIGGTPSSYPLEVYSATGDANLYLKASQDDSGADTIFRQSVTNSGASNYLYFGDGADSDVGYIRYAHFNDSMYFITDTAERMRLNSTGLGIGGTPTVNHDVIGSGTVASRIYSSTGGTVYSDWTSGSNAFRLDNLAGNATFSNYTTNGATQFSQSGTGSISMNWNIDSSPLLQLYNASTGSSASIFHRMNAGGRYVDYVVSFSGQYAYQRGINGIVSSFNDFDNHYFRDCATTTTQLNINNSGITSYGYVSDEYGNVRDVPSVGTKSTAYTLQAADAGRMVEITTGGSITVPTGVMGIGDVVTIVNQTDSTATITTSALTSYISGDSTNVSSATLDARGICTLLFTHGTVVFMSGNIS